MTFFEANPLPEVCLHCTEPDCDTCDHGRERWLLNDADEEMLRKKLKLQKEKRMAARSLRQ